MFISIPSSSSSKTDFICISCCVFYVGGFIGLYFLERSNSLLVVSSSHDVLWCVYAWSFKACDYLRNKLKIIENGVRMKNLLGSWCWRIYRLFFNRDVLTFLIWFNPPLLNYDDSLHDLVKLVVVIPTSPRTSKTEFVCESCARFGNGVSAVFTKCGSTALGPVLPHKTCFWYWIRLVLTGSSPVVTR